MDLAIAIKNLMAKLIRKFRNRKKIITGKLGRTYESTILCKLDVLGLDVALYNLSKYYIKPHTKPPPPRILGPGKNRVKEKPRYRRSILVLKP